MAASTGLSKSLYLPRMAELLKTERLSEKDRLFQLRLKDGNRLNHQPGQFVEVSALGVGGSTYFYCLIAYPR